MTTTLVPRLSGAILISALAAFAFALPASAGDHCSTSGIAKSQNKVNSCIDSIQGLGSPPGAAAPHSASFLSKKAQLQQKLFGLEAQFHDQASNCLSCFDGANYDTEASLGFIADEQKLSDAVVKMGFIEIADDLQEMKNPKTLQASYDDAVKEEGQYDKGLQDSAHFDLPCANPVKKPDVAMPTGASFFAAISNQSLTATKDTGPEAEPSSPAGTPAGGASSTATQPH